MFYVEGEPISETLEGAIQRVKERLPRAQETRRKKGLEEVSEVAIYEEVEVASINAKTGEIHYHPYRNQLKGLDRR